MKLFIDAESGRLVGDLPPAGARPVIRHDVTVSCTVVFFGGVPIAAKIECRQEMPFIEVPTEVLS
jgi:hypothetical protein